MCIYNFDLIFLILIEDQKMYKSLTVSKKSSLPQQKNRNPSINMKMQESNLFNTTANIDLSKFLKTDECKKNQWLTKLNDKPLLELITDNLPDKQMAPVNETELNCYQRLKKLLSMQTGTNYDEKQSDKHQCMLEDVAVLEDRLNKLQYRYNESSSAKKNKSNKHIKSYMLSNSSSFYDRNGQGLNFSLNSTQKSLVQGRNTATDLKKRSLKSPQRKTTINFSIKDHVSEFKTVCFDKFINYKKDVNEKVYSQIEEYIENKIHKKMEEIINCKFSEMHITKEQNSKFKMILLEKQLEIETLKKELKIKEDIIQDQEKVETPQCEIFVTRKHVQQFYQDYQNMFGDMSLADLKTKLDYMEGLYFNKYADKAAKEMDRFTALRTQKQNLQVRLREQESIFKAKERDLNAMINQIRKNKALDNSEETHQIYNKIPEYKIKCKELQILQKFIFNKYLEWKNSKNQCEIKIIDLVSGEKIEKYQQMIEAMLEFNRHIATQEKSIEYMTKILSSVQKLKKIITPSKCYEKLEPMKVFQQIESILKNPKKRRERKLRTIHKEKTEAEGEYLMQS